MFVRKLLEQLKAQELNQVKVIERLKAVEAKVKFATQAQAELVLNRSWRLSDDVEFGNVWISRDLDEAERTKRREMINEAKQKNEQRTEEEKSQFYWKVKDMKMLKIKLPGN
ncbi:hypothetical protein E2C01_069675 [Portunus trituberculatus]|uniref:Uncharacterized protein n=1 Tax=Portunus trituberculatus TaxID=210409 RepID=A0A5B7I074_PORTR|nr:hypothetical protein [Portunus trituberculatus]